MRTAFIIILLFLTYSLFYLSPSKSVTKENVEIKFLSEFHKVIKQKNSNKLKTYTITDINNSLKNNFVIIYEIMLEQTKKYQKIFLYASCLLIFSSIILTLIFHKTAFSFVINFINNFEFSLGDTLIVLISLFSLGSWFFLKQNFWQEVGVIIFVEPFAFLIVASINLKIYDFNYPIWSRLFKSFFVPIITGFLIILLR